MPDPAPVQPLDGMLTIAQVAHQLDVEVRTVRRIVSEGRFFPPIYPFGPRSPRWHQRDIDTWVWVTTRGLALHRPGPVTPDPGT